MVFGKGLESMISNNDTAEIKSELAGLANAIMAETLSNLTRYFNDGDESKFVDLLGKLTRFNNPSIISSFLSSVDRSKLSQSQKTLFDIAEGYISGKFYG